MQRLSATYANGHGGPSVTEAKTRTGRSRLEHRHGWLDVVWREATT